MSNSNCSVSKYSYEIFERPLTKHELSTVGEVAVWHEYVRTKGSGTNLALQELLRRHDKLLKKLAHDAQTSRSWVSEFEDKVQNARYGAMRAYERFDLEHSKATGARLSTYVQSVVHNHLKNSHDEESFIDCPSGCRLVRSYLTGAFDGNLKKKAEVEKRLEVYSRSDRQALKQKYCLLTPTFKTLTPVNGDGSNANIASLRKDGDYAYAQDMLVDENFKVNHFVSEIQVEKYLGMLKPRHQSMLRLLMSGMTMREVAVKLGTSETTVRGSLRTIRRLLKTAIETDNEAEALLLIK